MEHYTPIKWFLFLALLIDSSQTYASSSNGSDTHGGDAGMSTNTRTPTQIMLSNGKSFPLIGLGVGNLQHERIPDALTSVFANDKKIRLIDTARASYNEHIIAQAISDSKDVIKSSGDRTDTGDNNDDVIHVVTKVWYTHLGYERTKLSVTESLKDLSSATSGDMSTRIHVHMLLHWPRCDDNIPWMNCEEEENNLPQYVKDISPPPHLNKENAWKDSWRALEEIYTAADTGMNMGDNNGDGNGTSNNRVSIASIGVSNFDFNDLNTLIQECVITPQILQGNVWSVMFDPRLMKLMDEHNILFQAYNVMNGIMGQRSKAPKAFSVLTKVSQSLTHKLEKGNLRRVSGSGKKKKKESLEFVNEAMVVMAYLLQEGIGIIPRASSMSHQKENSPETLKLVPLMSKGEKEVVKNAMTALLRGEDLKVVATFHNSLSTGPVQIFWKNTQNGEEIPVQEIHPGQSDHIETHPGHKFVAYHKEKNLRQEFFVKADYGQTEVFRVDEF
jgi:diketogulonate reductase-like aldo/keto reductase